MKRAKLVQDVTIRDKDFSQWYTDICLKAELIDYSDVKGFFIYLPYGYAIWENIQIFINKKLKTTNHENVYFPLLFTENLFQKEKEHIEGFSLEAVKINQLDNKLLSETLIIRPTSEVLFSQYYAKIIQSYRDLPKLFNQWCSVVRLEKNTKPFLRGKEFLWQEGHTVHATKKEALKECHYILDLYKKLGKNLLAIPFIFGRKTLVEKFKGAKITYSIEALMYDGQSLQSGTSHYLGTNFSEAFSIKFQDSNLQTQLAHQTSWGISTRLIGAVIMIHGDDEGLNLPPYLAPIQIVIIPIQYKNESILSKAKGYYTQLKKKYRVSLDQQDKHIGWKFSYYELKGVPIRIEIGEKDLERKQVIIFIRHNFEKVIVAEEKLLQTIPLLLKQIHQQMFQKALNYLKQNIHIATTYKDFKTYIKYRKGYVKMSIYANEAELLIKEETGATARVILDEELITEYCPVTQKKANQTILFARAY
ncbi:MAG: proline--tRNA ligase [Vigna little leaf phytoplasma]|nr:proline--tRNA ligase [Vigna little leaf phytoplasma]